jgi:hypothetical protein
MILIDGPCPRTAVTLLLVVIGAYAFAAPASRASARQDSAGTLRETSPGPTQELIRQFEGGRTRRDKVDAIGRLSGPQRRCLAKARTHCRT